jgi:GH24 family phage-related lysozyme (muramidase)
LCAGEAIFQRDALVYVGTVQSLPNWRSLNANQFSALVSLAYNCHAPFKSGSELRTLMGKKDTAGVCKFIGSACKGAWQKNSGLKARRQAEMDLCTTTPSAALDC